MPPTFAQALQSHGVSAGALEEAERRRNELGGGLDLALLELRLLDEAGIGEVWASVSGLPRPSAAQLGAAAHDYAALFPKALSERYGMVPLGLVRRQLSLLVRHPVDLATVDEIGFLLSRPLRLLVGSDLELGELQTAVYGVELPPRLAQLRRSLQWDAQRSAEPVAAYGPHQPPEGRPTPPARSRVVAGLRKVAARATGLLSPDGTFTEPSEVSGSTPLPAADRPLERRPTVALPRPEFWHSAGLGLRPSPLASEDQATERDGRLATVLVDLAEPTAAGVGEGLSASSPRQPEALAAEPPPAPDRAGAEAIEVPAVVVAEALGTPPVAAAVALAELAEPAAPNAAAIPEPAPLVEAANDSASTSAPPRVRRLAPSEALGAFRDQRSRDGLSQVALAFLGGAFDFVALFGKQGSGFRILQAASGDGPLTGPFPAALIEATSSRVLRTVVEGRAPYVGPVPADDPLSQALAAVGRSRLRTVLLYPIVVRDRAVAVMYGDRGGESLAPRQLSDVALVLAQLGGHFERVLREQRKPSQGILAHAILDARPVAPLPTSAPAGREAGGAANDDRAAIAVIAHQASAPSPAQAGEGVPTQAELARSPEAPEESWEEMALDFSDEDADRGAAMTALSGSADSVAVPSQSDAGKLSSDVAPTSEIPSSAAATGGARAAEPLALEAESPFAAPVRAFLSGDMGTRAQAAAALRLGGAQAASALAARFPGPLFVFRMSIDELPGPEAMGPLMALFASLGADAIPALTELADAAGEEKRFWATVLLAKMGQPQTLPALARRLMDPAPDVSLAARRGLRRLRSDPEFAVVLSDLLAALEVGTSERRTLSIRALGEFHHLAAVPNLIALVGHRDQQIALAAADALREISRHDYGDSAKRWNAWWASAQHTSRVWWLIEALSERDRDLRLAAISELTELTGFDFGYRSDDDPRRQTTPLARWREWWERDGRLRHV